MLSSPKKTCGSLTCGSTCRMSAAAPLQDLLKGSRKGRQIRLCVPPWTPWGWAEGSPCVMNSSVCASERSMWFLLVLSRVPTVLRLYLKKMWRMVACNVLNLLLQLLDLTSHLYKENALDLMLLGMVRPALLMFIVPQVHSPAHADFAALLALFSSGCL